MSNNKKQLDNEQFVQSELAPHSWEAEQAVLGAIMSDSELFGEAAQIIGKDHFFSLKHNYIWQAMARVRERGEPVEYITVYEELRDQRRLDDVTPSYLTELGSKPYISSHALVYVKIVQRLWHRREGLKAADRMAELMRDSDLSSPALFEEVSDLYQRWAAGFHQEDGHATLLADTVPDIEQEVMQLLDDPYEDVYPTGLTNVDGLFDGGLREGELWVPAARPGMGKSSLLPTVQSNMAQRGIKTAIFSLEMSNQQMAKRFASIASGIDSRHLRRPPQDFNWVKFWEGEALIRDGMAPIYMYSKGSMTLRDIEAQIKKLSRDGYKFFGVDYLQLVNPDGYFGRADNRVQEVGQVSRGLKAMALDYGVVIAAPSQLSRSVEQRADKRPVLSDLRETGSIEQDADIVTFIYRDIVYNPDADPYLAELITAKYRNGKTGAVKVEWVPSQTMFKDILSKAGTVIEDWD